MPVEDGWADVVISNGVFNLCADKQAVFSEVWRVLRPGGVLQFADIANGNPVPAEAMRHWLRAKRRSMLARRSWRLTLGAHDLCGQTGVVPTVPTRPPPSREVCAAFGVGEVSPLPGGQGATFTTGEVVLKPVLDEREAEWLAAVFDALPRLGNLRVIRPVAAVDGR